jgi:hypothetical protein
VKRGDKQHVHVRQTFTHASYGHANAEPIAMTSTDAGHAIIENTPCNFRTLIVATMHLAGLNCRHLTALLGLDVEIARALQSVSAQFGVAGNLGHCWAAAIGI